jgi:hypothetical protein
VTLVHSFRAGSDCRASQPGTNSAAQSQDSPGDETWLHRLKRTPMEDCCALNINHKWANVTASIRWRSDRFCLFITNRQFTALGGPLAMRHAAASRT